MIRTGDCLAGMREIASGSIDSIVSDPPYGCGFMARDWDRALPDPEVWIEALRVAKPGAHLVAFGLPRLYHRLACQIEDAGWVLRDSLLWLFGSGFPKSLDVSKAIDKAAGAEREVVGVTDPSDPRQAGGGGLASGLRASAGGRETPLPITAPATPEAARWSGWGTALKPAYEPIILARKPLIGTVAANVLEHGTGAINVDGCRIEGGERTKIDARAHTEQSLFGAMGGSRADGTTTQGRWPANLLLGCACDGDHDPGCAVAMLDEQSGESRDTAHARGGTSPNPMSWDEARSDGGRVTGHADTGGASRFFYTAKSSRAEREAGLSGERRNVNDGRATSIDNPYQRGDTQRLNTHATVKPIDLMRWLVRLVTPPGGVVLDPFAGSGTTGCAAALEGFDFLGYELDAAHAEIARKRIAHWRGVARDEARQGSLFEEPAPKPSPLGLAVQGELWGDG